MLNEHGMPIYLEIHKGHRRGDLNFGVTTGLIEEFTIEQMREFRQLMCVVIGIAENAFRDGQERRFPAAKNPDAQSKPAR